MQKYKVYINKEYKIITHDWDLFSSKFNLINAAGGVVFNSDNQILMIYRNGKWDLPKGKLENNESMRECAIREIREECGIQDLEIIDYLQDTYHTYEIDGKSILKRTAWFKMKAKGNMQLTPQIEEGISKAEWVNRSDIDKKTNKTFATIRDLLSMI